VCVSLCVCLFVNVCCYQYLVIGLVCYACTCPVLFFCYCSNFFSSSSSRGTFYVARDL